MRQAHISVWRRHPVLTYGSIGLLSIGGLALIVVWVYWQSLYRGMPTLPDRAEL